MKQYGRSLLTFCYDIRLSIVVRQERKVMMRSELEKIGKLDSSWRVRKGSRLQQNQQRFSATQPVLAAFRHQISGFTNLDCVRDRQSKAQRGRRIAIRFRPEPLVHESR